MTGRSSQRKGSEGEREFAKVINRHGFEVKRTPRSGGMEFHGDLWGMKDHHWEVKRVERLDLPAAWRQACADARSDQVCVVAHRKNGQPWMVTLNAEDYLGLLEEVVELRATQDALTDKLASWESA